MNQSSPPADASEPAGGPPGAQSDEAGARHWMTDTHVMLVLRGDLDHRVERHITDAAEQARRSGVTLLVDASAVTYLNVDVLALFLDAHPDPGVSFTPPLPEAFVRIMEMTGTRSVFSL